MLLLVLAVAMASAAGQTPAERSTRPEPPPLVTARLAGVVTAAETKTPLARVRVVLTSASVPFPRVAITDAYGRWAIDRLPAGLYEVTCSRSGYLTRRFDAPIDLSERQQVDSIAVALDPARVIHGRILDEDGTPLVGARLEALRPSVEQGARTLAALATATSDDLGRFRLTGLPAGVYLVTATDPAFERVGDDRGPLSYPPTFYPGVNTQDAAVPVRAGLAQDEQAIEFQLRLVHPVTLTGRLLSFDGQPFSSAAVIMSPQLENRLVGASVGQAEIQPDGRFTFRNVPPGRYVIRARGETSQDSPALFATFAVAVQGRDVGQIEMTLTPGAIVQGQLLAESRHGFTPPPLPSLRVRAPLMDGTAFGDSVTGTLAASGAFRLSGLISGSHVFAIEGLTFPWRIAEARMQGRDVADQGFDVVSRQEYRNVRLLLTDTGAGVSGTVAAPPGAALGEVLVIAFPADPLKRTLPLRFVRTGHPAPNGTYRIVDLIPGEYRVVAVLGVTETDAYSPATLERLVPASTPVLLREAQVASVTLRVISATPHESLP